LSGLQFSQSTMANTATGPYPPGIYRIVVADGSPFESQRLTYDDNHNRVTVLPAGVDDDSNQEVIYYFHDKLNSICLSLISSFN
jgi:hypothetical protein